MGGMGKCAAGCSGFCIVVMNIIAFGGILCLLGFLVWFGIEHELFKVSDHFKIGLIIAIVVGIAIFIFCFVTACINNRVVHGLANFLLILVALASLGFGLYLIIDKEQLKNQLGELWAHMYDNYEPVALLEQSFRCCSWGILVDVVCLAEWGFTQDCSQVIWDVIDAALLPVALALLGLSLFLIIGVIISCCVICKSSKAATDYTSQAGGAPNQVNYSTVNQPLTQQNTSDNYNYTW